MVQMDYFINQCREQVRMSYYSTLFWSLELKNGSKKQGIVAAASEEWGMGNPTATKEETG